MVALLDDVLAAFPEGSSTPIAVGLISVVSLNVVVRLAKSFERDAKGILRFKETVLKRGQVKDSMDGYDKLFDGARENVGSLHQEESIKTREREYKSMINNFYNLVTDFYEFGWGQVSKLRSVWYTLYDVDR